VISATSNATQSDVVTREESIETSSNVDFKKTIQGLFITKAVAKDTTNNIFILTMLDEEDDVWNFGDIPTARKDIDTIETANAIITKYSSDGTYVSTYKIGYFDTLVTFSIDSGNNFIILSLNSSRERVITKLTVNYEIVFEYAYNDNNFSKIDRLVIDSSDNYYIVGITNEMTGDYIQSYIFTRTNIQPLFILKLNSTGEVQWEKLYTYGNGYNQGLPSISINQNGDLVIFSRAYNIESWTSGASNYFFYSVLLWVTTEGTLSNEIHYQTILVKALLNVMWKLEIWS